MKLGRDLLRGTLTGVICWAAVQAALSITWFSSSGFESWGMLLAWLVPLVAVAVGLCAERFSAFARGLFAAAITTLVLCIFLNIPSIIVQARQIELGNGEGLIAVTVLMMSACGSIAGTIAAGIITFVRQRKNALSDSLTKQEDAPSQGWWGCWGRKTSAFEMVSAPNSRESAKKFD